MMGSKGVAVVVSLVVAFIASWQLYIKNFFGWELSFIVLAYLLAGAIVIKIILAFIKGSKRSFGR